MKKLQTANYPRFVKELSRAKYPMLMKAPDYTGNNYDPKECPICQQSWQNGQECAFSKCRHIFHAECIERWGQNSFFCPVCRKLMLHLK